MRPTIVNSVYLSLVIVISALPVVAAATPGVGVQQMKARTRLSCAIRNLRRSSARGVPHRIEGASREIEAISRHSLTSRERRQQKRALQMAERALVNAHLKQGRKVLQREGIRDLGALSDVVKRGLELIGQTRGTTSQRKALAAQVVDAHVAQIEVMLETQRMGKASGSMMLVDQALITERFPDTKALGAWLAKKPALLSAKMAEKIEASRAHVLRVMREPASLKFARQQLREGQQGAVQNARWTTALGPLSKAVNYAIETLTRLPAKAGPRAIRYRRKAQEVAVESYVAQVDLMLGALRKAKASERDYARHMLEGQASLDGFEDTRALRDLSAKQALDGDLKVRLESARSRAMAGLNPLVAQ